MDRFELDAPRVPRRIAGEVRSVCNIPPGPAQALRASIGHTVSSPAPARACRMLAREGMRTLSVPWRVSRHERFALRRWRAWLWLGMIGAFAALVLAVR